MRGIGGGVHEFSPGLVFPSDHDDVSAAVIQDEMVAFGIGMPIDIPMVRLAHLALVPLPTRVHAENLPGFEESIPFGSPISFRLASGLTELIEEGPMEFNLREADRFRSDILNIDPFPEQLPCHYPKHGNLQGF